MSKRYIGGLITKSPTVPTTSAAPGIWTLDQALYYIKAGTWPVFQLYVEDVFSTYLYTGNGSTQTITNGIDLAGQGGMVWIKGRSGATDHALYDTARGATFDLASNTTAAQTTQSTGLTSFSTTGFSISSLAKLNTSSATYASWTFREAANFFDVVTYTGNGTVGRTVAHSLGVAPGCMIVKRTDSTGVWLVYHRSRGNGEAGYLNLTNAFVADSVWNYTDPTATQFTVASDTNTNGATYVAYLFAHDTSSTGLIQCGSYTGNGSSTGPVVALGWEPQWVMIKAASTTGGWQMLDEMRGMPVGSAESRLSANVSNAEDLSTQLSPTATGFQLDTTGAPNQSGETYIYIAIRRGPMRTPTSGTSVFTPIKQTTTGFTTISGVGFSPDLAIARGQSAVDNSYWVDKLRGPSRYISANNTNAEVSDTAYMLGGWTNDGAITGSATNGQFNGYNPDIQYYFRRAPSFFDEVCYTGTGSTVARNHNLGVAPELAIFKARSGVGSWLSWSTGLTSKNYSVKVNLTNAQANEGLQWIDVSSTTFTLDGGYATNGTTYVAYLFATCPGVSKVGSYTGTGALQTINCGFTTGARFVLIKRTDSTGDWYVWDSARGISSGNDPYLLLNSTAAEVTGTNYVDTDTTGFKVTAAAPAGINASGGSYIFLAIA